jgi:hypothetical protein
MAKIFFIPWFCSCREWRCTTGTLAITTTSFQHKSKTMVSFSVKYSRLQRKSCSTSKDAPLEIVPLSILTHVMLQGYGTVSAECSRQTRSNRSIRATGNAPSDPGEVPKIAAVETPVLGIKDAAGMLVGGAVLEGADKGLTVRRETLSA